MLSFIAAFILHIFTSHHALELCLFLSLVQKLAAKKADELTEADLLQMELKSNELRLSAQSQDSFLAGCIPHTAYIAFIVVFIAFCVLSVLLIQALWRNNNNNNRRNRPDVEAAGRPNVRAPQKQPEIY